MSNTAAMFGWLPVVRRRPWRILAAAFFVWAFALPVSGAAADNEIPVDAPQDELMLFITRYGELIGGIGITQDELGYWLAEPHWGQGFGTEAARAVTRHAFTGLAYDSLVASYQLGNAASRRILLGLGFQETGQDVAFSRARGAEVPIMRMALTRQGWAEAKERKP